MISFYILKSTIYAMFILNVELSYDDDKSV